MFTKVARPSPQPSPRSTGKREKHTEPLMAVAATSKKRTTRSSPTPLAQGANAGVLRFGSTEVKLSNLNKVLYPATGFTKGEMIAYYVGMADYILPHLKGRKLTRKRYP